MPLQSIELKLHLPQEGQARIHLLQFMWPSNMLADLGTWDLSVHGGKEDPVDARCVPLCCWF